MGRNIDRRIVYNDSEAVAIMLARRGKESVEHYGKIDINPIFLEDRAALNTKKHVFTIGDRLFKLAYKEYGDSQYWYLLAWWNKKPTDFHCKVGDVIYIPFPLQDVLYLWNRNYR